MSCLKTGATAHFGFGHCYAGDIYECKECGNKVMVCNENSWHRNLPFGKEEVIVDMQK